MNINSEDMLEGKDWVITVTIPNKIIRKYPRLVRLLQLRINMELQGFNRQIRINEIGEKQRYGKTND